MAPQEQSIKPEEWDITTTTSDEAVYAFKSYSPQQLEQRALYRARQVMPDWAVKEDIVISGMSGRFPESDTLEEFECNLYNNIDMIVENERRWPLGYRGLPKRSGKLKDIASFDHHFFKANEKVANLMDAAERIMLEITFEALWDAGLDPSVLAGTRTGVYLGQCFDEYMAAYAEDYTRLSDYRPCFFALLANVFDFRGPQLLFDTACASGFSAFHEAMVSLRSGQCDRALVIGLNLGLRAKTQFHFVNLNMMSPDGKCKCLDEDANGYAKGEACVAVVLQKKSEAKRIYATVVHTKTNCDGNKNIGITFPSFELQREVIEDTYHEAKIDPLEVDFCEAHCTGTQAGDPSEMRAITEAMCKGRTKPLLIGAIKSVIGHTEASSGLCALVKSILCFERQIIPANLHLNKINHRIEGLVSGILQPVITNTPYTGKYIALNCFGFGGVNVHAVIKKHEVNSAESVSSTHCNLPRLITFCGPTQETLDKIIDFLKNNPDQLTPGYLSLLNDVSKTSPFPGRLFNGMPHRGFVVLDKSAEAKNERVPVSEVKCQQIQDKVAPPVCFVFTGMGSQWTAMGQQLINFPAIKSTFEKCVKVLKQIDSNFNLMKILTDTSEDIFKSPLNCFVAIAAIQIGLVDLLTEMDITADHIIGHSIGELVCAYADGSLSAEETIACAFWRGQCIEAWLVKDSGAMAAVACTWEEATEWCASLANGKVWPACHNGIDSVTISGKKKHVEVFLQQLREKNDDIFAKMVNSSGVAFHSPLIEEIRDVLSDQIRDTLGKATHEKSSKWISSTYANSSGHFDANYLVDNLINPVYFHDALKQVPGNAVFIELGPHHLLQTIIKRTLLMNGPGPVKYVSAMSRGSDNTLSILQMLGELYSHGLNPAIERLYPKVKYPVPRGTAPLHSLLRWRHDQKFTVTQYPDFFNEKMYESTRTIDLQHPDDKYLQDHYIDGRILFPATGYLYLAWTQIAKLLGVDYRELPIIFEDVTLHRATIMSKSSVIKFNILFNQQIGQFSITEGSSALAVSGRIRLPNGGFLKHQNLLDSIKELESEPALMEMKAKDIYKEFRLRGYDYRPDFQAISHVRQVEKTLSAKVLFKNWVTFVDGLIQMAVLGQPFRGLFLPVRIDYLACDPKQLFASSEGGNISAVFDGALNIGVAPGIEYQNIKANLAPRKLTQQPIEEIFEFVANDELNLPYIPSRSMSDERCQKLTDQLKNYQNTCSQILAGSLELDEEKAKQFEVKFESELTTSPMLLKLIEQLKSASNAEERSKVAALETLEQDLLFQSYKTERFLRSQLEILCENLTYQQMLESTVQVLEVNQTPVILADNILPLLYLSTLRGRFAYRLLHSGFNKFTSMNLASTNSQHEWLAEKSKFPADLTNIDLIIYKDASTCPLLATTNAINFETLLESAWTTLAERGFALVILRDQVYPVEAQLAQILGKDIGEQSSRAVDFEVALGKSPFRLVSHKSDVFGVHAYLIRKLSHELILGEQHFLPIHNTNIKGWFGLLQERIRELTKDEANRGNIWLLANEPTSGVLGFISCLHKEALGGCVRCIFNVDPEVDHLDTASPEIAQIIQLDLVSNVLGPKRRPGTYKHFTLPIEDYEPQPVEHCYLNVTTRGDLASLKWFESQHKYWPLNAKPGQKLVTVYYAPLNFRDIMLATGRLPPDALPDEMKLDDCILGFEFAGRDENNNRVMGMITSKGLATSVIVSNTKFLWPIPDHWTMDEASTIPVAYSTAYYALQLRGKLQPGESVLIHSGSGAVGQAAIAVCLGLKCQLFITVGSDKKRDILMKLYPELKPHQFASSRNTAFSQMILQATGGRGVNVVLNSLAAEKLQASVDCLAESGRFLEIGKFDMAQNSELDLSKMFRNKTFHSIILDALFIYNGPKIVHRHRDQIWKLIKDGIARGVVRPLQRTLFTAEQAEEAFRYMANGEHIGKVVVCIRPEESDHQGMVKAATIPKIPAIPRTVFFAHKSYIITGGLGGFGLELIGWMIEREARHFVVTSRTGVKDLYQQTRLDQFTRAGAVVKICTADVSVESGAEQVITEAEALGFLGGIFNLAMILSDALFDNMTVESFEAVLKPKSDSLIHLDRITRKRCPQVDYFVAFSSCSSGLGNPGQVNYGFANSVMERICEQRRAQGLHGLAIQWGPIGDVGYIIDNFYGNDVVIKGALPQRMPSCLATVDRLLQLPFPVVSNLIKADYKFEGSGKISLIQTVTHILGVKDYEKLQPNVTLGDLGMDSLMDVEVKQALERDYDVVLSMAEVRKLTIGKLKEIEAGKAKRCDEGLEGGDAGSTEANLIPTEAVVYLNEIVNGSPIIFLPQIDATFEHLLPLAAKLNRPVIGLNWTKECADLKTIAAVAGHYIEVIERALPGLEDNWDLVGYSFGGIVAIEMGVQLNRRQHQCRLGPYRKLVLLDASPKTVKLFTTEMLRRSKIEDKQSDEAQVGSILMFLLTMPTKLTIDFGKIHDMLLRLSDTTKRIEFVRDLFKKMQKVDIAVETLEFLIQSHYNKMVMMYEYECDQRSLPGDLMLVRASKLLVVSEGANGVREDYWLGELITGQVQLHILEGDHQTFITENYPQLIGLICDYFEH